MSIQASNDTSVVFTDVTFAYPGDPEGPVFTDLSCRVPTGMVAMVGPNGVGKTTFMLLSGARLFPRSGVVTLLGRRTSDFTEALDDPTVEEQRNRLCSFVYQNMEFETEDSLGEILELVAGTARLAQIQPPRLKEVVETLELGGDVGLRLQELSKGAMQRAIIALSVLYGSPLLCMDEAVFAVESHRAERVFSWLRNWSKNNGATLLFSAHDIDFSRRHADGAVLFGAGGSVEAGSSGEILSRDRLENAFRADWETLHRRQALYREMLRGEG